MANRNEEYSNAAVGSPSYSSDPAAWGDDPCRQSRCTYVPTRNGRAFTDRTVGLHNYCLEWRSCHFSIAMVVIYQYVQYLESLV